MDIHISTVLQVRLKLNKCCFIIITYKCCYLLNGPFIIYIGRFEEGIQFSQTPLRAGGVGGGANLTTNPMGASLFNKIFSIFLYFSFLKGLNMMLKELFGHVKKAIKISYIRSINFWTTPLGHVFFNKAVSGGVNSLTTKNLNIPPPPGGN